MTEVKRPKKASKRLSDVTFEHEGAHVALVAKQQGGGAVGHNYALLMKSARSPEVIQKMQSVQVTMELPDFLEKFFMLWEDEAKVLAHMMGYREPAETQAEENDEDQMKFDKWVEENIGSIEVMKSLKSSEFLELDVAKLSDEDYLALLQDQKKIEKAMHDIAASKEAGSTVLVEDKQAVEPKGSKVTKSKGKINMDEIEVLQKSLDEQKVQLEKAMQVIASMEAEKKEQVLKSKIAQIADVMKDQTQAEVVAKAALKLESEDEFNSFVQVIKSLNEQIEKSALFQEQGTTVNTEAEVKVSESRVADLLKAQFAKK